MPRTPFPAPHRTAAALLTALFAAALLLALPARSALAFGEVTIQDEKEMGQEFDKVLRSKMQIVSDPEITNYVDKVVERLVDAKKPMPFPIKSAVVANRAMNAFAIPGGYIYVFTGLIAGVDDEDEFAGVLAHELGHASGRHVARRMEQMQKVNILSTVGMLAGAFLGGGSTSELGPALMVGSQAMATSAFLTYSQAFEREADNVGLDTMLNAGYDPRGMPETFEILLKRRWFSTGTNDSVPSYLSTHPGLEDRIAYLNNRIDRLPKDKIPGPSDNTAFQRVQALVRGKMSDPATTLGRFAERDPASLTAMDHLTMGMAYKRLNRTADAAKEFDAAYAAAPDDTLVLRERGAFLYLTGHPDQALPLLQKAVFKNPRDALAMFYMGRLLGDSGRYADAIGVMRQVLRVVPEDAEVHETLGRLLGQSGDPFHARLQLGLGAHYALDEKMARFHFDQAERYADTPDKRKELEDARKKLGGPSEKKPGDTDKQNVQDTRGAQVDNFLPDVMQPGARSQQPRF